MHFPTLHHEVNLSELVAIRQRITGYGDDIGELADMNDDMVCLLGCQGGRE